MSLWIKSKFSLAMTNKLAMRKSLLIYDDCKAALIAFVSEQLVRFHLPQKSERVARNDAMFKLTSFHLFV